eukprot:Gb_11913 [translate_table: standard]
MSEVGFRVETISRLAQWKTDSLASCNYRRSDPFKIGIWNCSFILFIFSAYLLPIVPACGKAFKTVQGSTSDCIFCSSNHDLGRNLSGSDISRYEHCIALREFDRAYWYACAGVFTKGQRNFWFPHFILAVIVASLISSFGSGIQFSEFIMSACAPLLSLLRLQVSLQNSKEKLLIVDRSSAGSHLSLARSMTTAQHRVAENKCIVLANTCRHTWQVSSVYKARQCVLYIIKEEE